MNSDIFLFWAKMGTSFSWKHYTFVQFEHFLFYFRFTLSLLREAMLLAWGQSCCNVMNLRESYTCMQAASCQRTAAGPGPWTRGKASCKLLKSCLLTAAVSWAWEVNLLQATYHKLQATGYRLLYKLQATLAVQAAHVLPDDSFREWPRLHGRKNSSVNFQPVDSWRNAPSCPFPAAANCFVDLIRGNLAK